MLTWPYVFAGLSIVIPLPYRFVVTPLVWRWCGKAKQQCLYYLSLWFTSLSQSSAPLSPAGLLSASLACRNRNDVLRLLMLLAPGKHWSFRFQRVRNHVGIRSSTLDQWYAQVIIGSTLASLAAQQDGASKIMVNKNASKQNRGGNAVRRENK